MDNTTINIIVKDSVNNIVSGASVVINVSGSLYNLISDSTGSAVVTFSLTSTTIGSITITANGYLQTINSYVISPTNNVFNAILSVDPSQINKKLQIVDLSRTPIANVSVSINGSVIGITDTSGSIQVITKAGQLTIQTNKSGYQPLKLSGNFTSTSFPSQLIASVLPTSKNRITFQTTPLTTVSISGNGITDSLQTDVNGLGSTNLYLIPGTYSVSVFRGGFTSVSTSINILSDVDTYSLPAIISNTNSSPTYIPPSSISSLVTNIIDPTGSELTNPAPSSFAAKKFGDASSTAIAPSGSTSSTPGASASTFSTALSIGGSGEAEYPSEWVYPNAGSGRYLTSSQARIYIGNLFIDEIDTIQYVYSNNRIPVYGYSSANVDAFGQGRRIVQGQIALNFVSEGYLFTVLSEYSKKEINANKSPKQLKDDAAISSLATLHTQQQALRTQQVNGDTRSSTAAQLTSISNQILSAYTALGSGAVASVKQVLANATTAQATSNAIVKNVAFDIIIKATGGGRTTTRKLSRCVLTSNEQVWDQTDNVVKDVYGFIGVEMN